MFSALEGKFPVNERRRGRYCKLRSATLPPRMAGDLQGWTSPII
jgi:hypothetical protein